MANPSQDVDSIFSHMHSRPSDDTVYFTIFPDFSLPHTTSTRTTFTEPISSLHSLHLQILNFLSPHTADYIWQHESFSLSVSSTSKPSCICSYKFPHLHGKLRFGDNLDDEWFLVYLLFQISKQFPDLSVKVWDTDGEFLLIEAAFHLPKWINPENSDNRVFIRKGKLHIVPRAALHNPTLIVSLNFLRSREAESRASNAVQSALRSKISEYPEKAKRNMHRVKVRVPVSVAQVLKHEPCLISLAVEGFYDRDIDTMKYAAKMEKFLSEGREEELVRISVRMSRAMYAQLVQQTFMAPNCYPMPPRTDREAYLEAELGMKIACGFEMMYQLRKKGGNEGKGTTWDAFRESLERSGYFEGLLPGSQEYRRLMENAEEYYKRSSLYTRASEMISAPVRCVDEILDSLHSANDFKGLEDPPDDDDDSWLYNGEDELNAALRERQQEMELYNNKQKRKQKSVGDPSDTKLENFDLGVVAKNTEAFLHKVSSYKGAEVPGNRNVGVDLDADHFMKNVESSIIGGSGSKGTTSNSHIDAEEGSSSDMDFDDYEDESDSEDDEEGGDTFMLTYSNALSEELKETTLGQSFFRANKQDFDKNEGGSNASEGELGEDFTPADINLNLVKSFLDSYSSQQGQAGPASNLLGLMGVKLPKNGNKE